MKINGIDYEHITKKLGAGEFYRRMSRGVCKGVGTMYTLRFAEESKDGGLSTMVIAVEKRDGWYYATDVKSGLSLNGCGFKRMRELLSHIDEEHMLNILNEYCNRPEYGEDVERFNDMVAKVVKADYEVVEEVVEEPQVEDVVQEAQESEEQKMREQVGTNKWVGKVKRLGKALKKPSTGNAELDKLIAEFTDCEFNVKGTWLWITGNTREHKEAFKEMGAHFSGKRKAWYVMNWLEDTRA